MGHKPTETRVDANTRMGPLDTFWHLINFAAPALGVALISTGAAKLMWRRDLAAVPWRRLAGWGATGGIAALLAGLVVFGRDGKMATYGLMILASALAMFWVGFGPGRR